MKLFICLSVVLLVACGIDGYKNPEKCDGPNEVHVDCKIPCRPTCRSILTKIPQPLCLPQEPCPPGCACRDGYVRNDDNICTKIEDCPKECYGNNSKYNVCGSACPKTCLNKDDNVACTKNCVFGCFCIDGYVLDDTNQCILPENCPVNCTELNTEYKKTGPINLKTCKTSLVKHSIEGKDAPGCFCKPGFISNELKECIPIEKCESCGEHEFYSNCKNYPCQDNCANPILSQLCDFKPGCYSGCLCEDGFIRDDKGVCVLRANCHPSAE